MNKIQQTFIALAILFASNLNASENVAFSAEAAQWTMTYDSMTWDKASEFCNSLGDGWRLPNQKELNVLHRSLSTLPKSIKLKRLWSTDSASNESFFENNKNAHFYVDIRDGESNWANHEDRQNFACTRQAVASKAAVQINDKQSVSEMPTAELPKSKSKSVFAGRCEGYGFQQGTDGFANCIMQMENAQAQASMQAQARAQLEKNCGLARSQGFLAPTRTGNFAESAQNANEAYSRCMAGLPPPHSYIINCNRNGSNFNCNAQ